MKLYVRYSLFALLIFFMPLVSMNDILFNQQIANYEKIYQRKLNTIKAARIGLSASMLGLLGFSFYSIVKPTPAPLAALQLPQETLDIFTRNCETLNTFASSPVFQGFQQLKPLQEKQTWLKSLMWPFVEIKNLSGSFIWATLTGAFGTVLAQNIFKFISLFKSLGASFDVKVNQMVAFVFYKTDIAWFLRYHTSIHILFKDITRINQALLTVTDTVERLALEKTLLSSWDMVVEHTARIVAYMNIQCNKKFNDEILYKQKIQDVVDAIKTIVNTTNSAITVHALNYVDLIKKSPVTIEAEIAKYCIIESAQII